MRRAFVAGATGFTGREVVPRLAEERIDVFAHVRPDSPDRMEWEARFTADGAASDRTPWDKEALTSRFRDLKPTHVFALLGTTRARAAKEGMSAEEAYSKIDMGLTVMLIEALCAAELKPRFVYLSALGSSEQSGNAYLRARGQTEQWLIRSGLPYTIVRPSFISGPGRPDVRVAERSAAKVTDAVLRGLSLFGAKRLRDRYRSLSNHDLAYLLVGLAGHDGFERRIVESDELQQLLALRPPPPLAQHD